jgi:hypothetical protein
VKAALQRLQMIAYPVTKDVGTPKNDRPELIEEIHVSG